MQNSCVQGMCMLNLTRYCQIALQSDCAEFNSYLTVYESSSCSTLTLDIVSLHYPYQIDGMK